ncbi:MAG: excinuclease ABC subunit UvrA [Bacteroidia bacterium]|nr:MAG: excinuclease ABC subunit UvrA [Bacteroidia bacterium]
MENIDVQGARVHNLKNISLKIPKNKLVVITGISGSGKSSLAFDTIFAEGQRRYMETFGAYARQFVGDMERPDVDSINGLSPVISIEQKTTNKNPRSTVGTITEIYDFVRLLFARIGEAYSYNTGKPMVKWSEDEIINNIIERLDGQKINILAPIVRGRKGHYRELFEDLRKKGFLKVRVDGEIVDITSKMQVDRYKIHDIELVVDRLQVSKNDRTRLSQSVQQALKMGEDLLFILPNETHQIISYSKHLMCAETGISYEEPSPNSFSFNSPYGACHTCKGLGNVYHINMSAVIPDEKMSIKKGGITPLGEEREASIYKQVAAFAKKQKIDLSKPIHELPEEQLNLILFGKPSFDDSDLEIDSSEAISFIQMQETHFEGVLNMIKRWFTSSSISDNIKDWTEKFMKLHTCPSCQGARLKKDSLWFKIDTKNIAEITDLGLDDLHNWFSTIENRLTNKQNEIAKDILKEIRERLGFLINVGLTYLTLNRPSKSLSGGEYQRIRLATQIGSQLQGITYILDEPSIGLHQRDNHKLITALQHLRDIKNSVLVVEHDKDIMLAADYLIDVGPKAGLYGGTIVAEGTPQQVIASNSTTAQFLNGKKNIPFNVSPRKGNDKTISLKGVSGNNLKNVQVDFPLGKFIVVTGVSGSGKSTLINDTLYPILSNHCFPASKMEAMPYHSIEGLDHIDKVIEIDQSPIGRTPRSNPATYCGFFTDIRTLFAALPEAKVRGYNAGRFSFNVKSGRCEVCEGGGMKIVEMNFLPDVYVHCEKCNGKRYNRETLEIRYKGKSISDVLDMSVDEAVVFFESVPSIFRKIKTLQDVGLGYITLGQSAVTLSGGEAQRVKLSTELSKKDTGKTFYILDEPSTGLHFQDIEHRLKVLNKLADKGNTVLVIEHNMDIIKSADYIIDLGPEGGNAGGTILYQGDLKGILKSKKSYTGQYLKKEI